LRRRTVSVDCAPHTFRWTVSNWSGNAADDESKLEARSLPLAGFSSAEELVRRRSCSVENDFASFFLLDGLAQLSSLRISVRILFFLSSATQRTASKDSSLLRADSGARDCDY
jgi:hypothetical protein